MKFCTQCGKQIADEARFCTACGTQCGETAQQSLASPIIQMQPATTKTEMKKTPHKKQIITLACAAVLLVGATLGGYFVGYHVRSSEVTNLEQNSEEEDKKDRKPTEGLEYAAKDGNYVVTGYHGNDVHIVIPAEYNEIPVVGVQEEAFMESEIQSVIFGGNIEWIGDRAFFGASLLKEVTISASVKQFGENVFRDCISLTTVEFEKDSKIENLGGYTFHGCIALKEIDLPDTITSLDGLVFYECANLKSINLPDSLQVIGDACFYGCTFLEKIELPNGVREIGWDAFENCTSIKKLIIPESVVFVDQNAFDGFTPEQTLVIRGSTVGWRDETETYPGGYLSWQWHGGCNAQIIYE